MAPRFLLTFSNIHVTRASLSTNRVALHRASTQTEFSDHIHQCPLAKEARTKPLWRLNALAASLLGLQSYRIAMYLTRLETYVTSLER